MDAKEKEFLQRLRATFRMEADEHLRAISAGLIELEKAPDPARTAEIIENIFREAHSLKGAARSVSIRDIESLCQPLESNFAALKRQELRFFPELFDLYHQTVDQITQFVSLDREPTSAERASLKDLIRRLNETGTSATPAPAAEATRPTPSIEATSVKKTAAPVQEVQSAPPPSAEEKATLAETVRIPTARLDPIFLQAEEMIQAKLAESQRVTELREIHNSLVAWKADWIKKQMQPAHLQGESSQGDAASLETIIGQVAALTQTLDQDTRSLSRMVDEHLEETKRILMLPVSMLAEILPKFVRDLAREQGKDVKLEIGGAEIEIDKRILDELKDPLIHLVRNCIDHGLEKPEERIRKNKPAQGVIHLAFSAREGRQVEILISDDGAGIDTERVKAAAIKNGLLSPETAKRLSPQEIWPLIFQSGLSTSPIITDLSGRGLGLAIVREKAEKLGGNVSVESQIDAGATFRLLLPLALTTFRGTLVRTRGHPFVVPTLHVRRALRVGQDEIKTVENQQTVRLEGQVLSLVELGDVLGLPVQSIAPDRRSAAKKPASVYAAILVIAVAEQSIAIRVDEILTEQEVLVKGLGKQLSRVRNIAGATVLGTGQVVPVLNVYDLMKSALQPGAGAARSVEVEKIPRRTGKILVAEDSITARTLLNTILQAAGYVVATAVDGADAFMQVRNGEFDLVVSDVDMPRMSGFELTTKIRSDKNLSELPVILVTALESREDRERGIEAGANAYIVKSSFDQSDLLEVIHRLI